MNLEKRCWRPSCLGTFWSLNMSRDVFRQFCVVDWRVKVFSLTSSHHMSKKKVASETKTGKKKECKKKEEKTSKGRKISSKAKVFLQKFKTFCCNFIFWKCCSVNNRFLFWSYSIVSSVFQFFFPFYIILALCFFLTIIISKRIDSVTSRTSPSNTKYAQKSTSWSSSGDWEWLKTLGLYVREVTADGNCFFRC